ncbi:hypothetical protein [Mycobacteroides abscessus]|uniref:hypothetical protein n=1 Tax=Mycobacteroides abscessus TaxID=36809 RepID=UPI001F204672|nr:hypothetical protein [Mycobacteroides abscessus]
MTATSSAETAGIGKCAVSVHVMSAVPCWGHWAVQVRTTDRSRHAPGSAMKIDKIDPPARVKFVRYSWAGGSPVGDWAGNPRAESQGAIVG